MINFTVYGVPGTAGSKVGHTIRRKDGSLVMSNGIPIVAMRDMSGDKGKIWRSLVQDAARDAYQGPLLTGAIKLSVCFVKVRPKGQFGKHGLRSWAPKYPLTAPDCTKLLRAIEDSLKNILWKDDAQVVQQVVEKRWGDRPCAIVLVEQMF